MKQEGIKSSRKTVKTKWNTALRLTAAALLCSVFMAQGVSADRITSYTYNREGKDADDYFAAPAPCPYNYEKSIHARDLGVDSLYKLSSLFVSDEYVYISAGASIIITDHDFQTKRIITGFTDDSGEQALTDINGLWVTEEGELYACEPGRGRVLHFNSDWTIKRILGRPEGIVISESVSYQPLKIAVDSVGRMYVVANNIYEGIVEMNADGTFSRYFGKVNVKFTAAQLFWRTLQTEAQRALSAAWLPVNFSNLTIDKEDFVYATVAGSGEKEPIRKLNAKGSNILRFPVSTEIKPHGDLTVNKYGQSIPTGESTITTVDVNEYGVYVVLDSKRSRIFAYDEDGYMLYAFGEAGITRGRFQTPADVRFMEDKLLVADRGSMSIEVYALNDYGRSIHLAAQYQAQSDYRAAAAEWEKAVDYNPSFQYAYVGIGKALYRDGDYEAARQYFLLGQDVEYYSEAYKKTRQSFVSDKFAGIALVAGILAVLWIVAKRLKKRRLRTGRVRGLK